MRLGLSLLHFAGQRVRQKDSKGAIEDHQFGLLPIEAIYRQIERFSSRAINRAYTTLALQVM